MILYTYQDLGRIQLVMTQTGWIDLEITCLHFL